ncbi:MAG: gamma-glutamyl-gamma-aminobutyrate hydrolase family protein [Bacteroidales bacterium]|nr:gamma-glutamyl-gamma-aminobutyrate hydrolase family protein [Bacteroidales bacterium]
MNGFRRLLTAATALLLVCASLNAARKPIIGISCGYNGSTNVGNTYIDAVINGGGIPVLLPVTDVEYVIAAAVAAVDGVVLTGGEDFDPQIYGEEELPECGGINGYRDTCDLLIAKYALKYKKPVLGICRGLQLMNIATGGTLYQDLPSQKGVHHRQEVASTIPTHGIKVEKNSILYDLMGSEDLQVNTFHHQAVKDLGKDLRIIAMSTDGVVEGFQSTGRKPKVLCVQFHPECLSVENNSWYALFKWLAKEAR